MSCVNSSSSEKAESDPNIMEEQVEPLLNLNSPAMDSELENHKIDSSEVITLTETESAVNVETDTLKNEDLEPDTKLGEPKVDNEKESLSSCVDNEEIEVESEHQGGAKLKILTRRKSSPDLIDSVEKPIDEVTSVEDEALDNAKQQEDPSEINPELPQVSSERVDLNLSKEPPDKELEKQEIEDKIDIAEESVVENKLDLLPNLDADESNVNEKLEGEMSTENKPEFNENEIGSVDLQQTNGLKDSDKDVENVISEIADAEKDTAQGTETNDLLKSSRNVFEVFPVEIVSQLQNDDTKDVIDVSENNKQDSNECSNQDGVLERTNFLSSFEQFLKTSTDGKQSNTSLSIDVTSASEDKHNCSKLSSKAKKVPKRHKSVSPHSTQDINSDIYKKAKERYPDLKELRVSLTTDDIKECQSIPSEKASKTVERKFIGRSLKSKSVVENRDAIENLSISIEAEAKDAKLKDNPDSSLSPGQLLICKTSEHSFDKDCAKPLKKRCRRGIEDSGKRNDELQAEVKDKSETAVKGKPADISIPINSNVSDFRKGCTSTESLEPHLKTDLDKCDNVQKQSSTEINTEKQNVPNKKTNKKTNKSRSRSKSRKKSTVKAQTSGSVEHINSKRSASSENTQINNTSTQKHTKQLNQDSIVAHLKKYPGRTCKLKNQNSIEKPVPKTILAKSVKVVSPVKKVISKTDGGVDAVKIKKKRRKKVKPWSWGNEKKRSKPKPKINLDNESKIQLETSINMNESPEKIETSSEPTISNNGLCDNKSEEILESISTADHAEKLTDQNQLPEKISNVLLDSEPIISSKKNKKSKKSKSSKCKSSKTITKLQNELPKTNCVVVNDALTESLESNTEQKSDNNENVIVENISRRDDHDQQKASTSETLDEKSFVDSVTQSLTLMSDSTSKKKTKRHASKKTNKKVKRVENSDLDQTQEVKESPEHAVEDLDNNNDVAEGLANLLDNEIDPADHELHVEHFPHVSPDSGIQSLAGSPAGNESPNSVILVNIETSNAQQNCNLLGSDSVSNTDKVNTVQATISKNGVLVPCSTLRTATCTSDVTTCSSANNDCLSSETSVTFNQFAPLPSPIASSSSVLSDDSSVKSPTDLRTFPYSDKFQSSSNNLSINCEADSALSVSPSKKKNRAKFLHLHKTSTLLQKGRLPTEKEKEYRLEDKFDYLGKVGAASTSNCDKDSPIIPDTSVTVCSVIDQVQTININNSNKTISGQTETNFKTLESSPSSTKHLNKKREQKEIAVKCVNDTVSNKDITGKTKEDKKGKRKHETLAITPDTISETASAKQAKFFVNDKVTIDMPCEEDADINKDFKNDLEVVEAPLEPTVLNTEISVVSLSSSTPSVSSTVTTTSSSITCSDSVVTTLSSIVTKTVTTASSIHYEDWKKENAREFELKNENNDFKDSVSGDEISDTKVEAETSLNDENKTLHEFVPETAVRTTKNSFEGIFMESPIQSDTNVITTQEPIAVPIKRKPGRPPLKKNKLLMNKFKNRFLNKVKRQPGRPPPLKTYHTLQMFAEKRRPGRPKGSKNKFRNITKFVDGAWIKHKTNDTNRESVASAKPKIKHGQRGRPKGSLNKPKVLGGLETLTPRASVSNVGSAKKSKHDLTKNSDPSGFSFPPMMQWRESRMIDTEEKKKRGRPRKHPLPVPGEPKIKKKRGRIPKLQKMCNIDDHKEYNVERSYMHHKSGKESSETQFSFQYQDQNLSSQILDLNEGDLFGDDDNGKSPPKIRQSRLHSFMKKKNKRGRKKGFKLHKEDKKDEHSENEFDVLQDFPMLDTEFPADFRGISGSENQPAQSVCSQDSDTSGAGSNLGARATFIQKWMELNKLKKHKSKKKMFHFKSKHKNIIDPVFIAEVDYLIESFPLLGISPETYLRVKPGEVPLPSIFKIVKINVKKKKKDKLFVFEKAKPLKPKNDIEFGSKDKIKLGRKMGILGDSFLDFNSDGPQQGQCNLPPKKRHKLFSALNGDEEIGLGGHHSKQEKRKGRQKKVRSSSPSQVFSFGDVQKKKDVYKMGRESPDGMASFASVAAMSSPTATSFTSLSPERSVTTLSSTTLSSTTQAAAFNTPCKETKTDLNSPQTLAVSPQADHKPSPDKTLKSSKSCDQESQSHDLPNESPDMSCDECTVLQASDTELNHEFHDLGSLFTSETVRPSSATLNKSVKRLKRKYRKSGKLSYTRLKKTKSKSAHSVEGFHRLLDKNLCQYDDGDTDTSVRRSVCSESEPLPIMHQDKRKHDNNEESDGETVVRKRGKICKRRGSDASQESDASIVKKQSGPVFQKKKFQKAGLYSDSYKDNDKSKDRDASATYLTFDLPLHFGHHMMKNAEDFQLPYDIWWLHFNDMLPKKGDGQQYRRIRNNIYVDARPVCRYDAHACTCKRPANNNEKSCGEECLNRMMYTECSPDLCPTSDVCANQSIQKHQFAMGTQKFLTKERGFGVRTTKPIKAGELIMEYLGEVVSEQEFRRRMTEEYSQECHHYCLNLDSGTVIDGYRMGNIARFVNHSCDPNCEMQKWNVNGTNHMCLFAIDNIEPGTELVYDYNFQSFNQDTQQMCKCGSENCRGIIGGKKQRHHGHNKSTEKHKLKGKQAKRKSKQKLDKTKDGTKHKSTQPGSHPQHQGIPLLSGHPHFSAYMTPIPVKPISKKERQYARNHTIFLVRNLDRIRDIDRIRNLKHSQHTANKVDKDPANFIKGTNFTKKDVFMTQLAALGTCRSMKTRRLTVAEEDTDLSKRARLAGVCKEIYTAITACKDVEGCHYAADLHHLPSKKNHPYYYQVIDEPIDLTMIQTRIVSGEYTTIETFERDMMKLFENVETYCDKKSEMGEKIKHLRTVFTSAKQSGMSLLTEILGGGDIQTETPPVQTDTPTLNTDTPTLHTETPTLHIVTPPIQSDMPSVPLSDCDSSDIMQASTPTTSVSSESDISEVLENKDWLQGDDEEEEVIRCICGIYKDEGLMIQCEKCYIWQHTDCMGVKGDEDNYLCEQCDPRPVQREVEIVPNSDDEEETVDTGHHGNHYYMTLMRDDMQIRLLSCVYVVKENQSRRNSYKKSGGLNKDKMDIFRIERLWKNEKGEKFAFGHMYVKPHETFHEPNRKFFPNEVFKTPLYEVVPLESITGYCCVMDLLTYCKGRPKGYREEDLYICEYRMDKTLHLFYKMSAKQRYAINTKSYCFEMHDKRLNPKRTYSPHEVPESYKRNWREKSSSSSSSHTEDMVTMATHDNKTMSDEEEDIPLVKVKIERRREKRERVNKFVESLSKGILSPSKKRSDLSYLLTDSKALVF